MARILEIIATSPEEAVTAARAGADRIELIAAMSEGGLTPSYGTIARTVSAVNIPVRVMVRPHSRHFAYSADDLETMAADIRAIRGLGAAGLVLGVLTADGQVDLDATVKLCAEAPDLPVTFHRAVDESRDVAEALRALEAIASVDRVLTSGGHADGVWHVRSKMRELQAATSLKLIAAKGLTLDRIEPFLTEAAGVHEIHLGTGVRIDGREDAPIDPRRVEACVRLLHEGAAGR